MRKNIFSDLRWLSHLSRLILIDDGDQGRSTNTSIVFCFHNGIINTLNKVHTKILGSLPNSQLNLRLILDKVNPGILERFRLAAGIKIKEYEDELLEMKKEQLGTHKNLTKDTTLFKFNEFARQIIKDKYVIQKFHDYLILLLNTLDMSKLKIQNQNLISEFEVRTKAYFYSNIEEVHIAAIVEGGGRSQLRTYGNYLLQRKLKNLKKEINQRCRIIIDIIPNSLQRTLNNHFHKNFGLNIFLERY
ncbi:hypothetical protein KAJ27_06565, partial [bacterium]|nr:hypothetical protein [bacterium]